MERQITGGPPLCDKHEPAAAATSPDNQNHASPEGSPTRYLDRKEAAAYVRQRGLPCSPNTLAKFATTGGGPVYRRFGNKAVYTNADLDHWIERKLSSPLRSTSQVAEWPA